MFKLIANWYKAKKFEYEMKVQFYDAFEAVLNNQTEIIEWVKNLYAATKDVPVDSLRQELVMQIAKLAHESNQK